MTVYPFNRGFRLKIIALCLDQSWFVRIGRSLIIPDYFDSVDEQDIVTGIFEFFEAYNRIPTDPDDLLVLCKGEHEELILTIYEERLEYDIALVKDVVIQWAREQAAKNVILESVDDVQRGDLSRVLTRMEEAVAIGSDLASPGINVVRDVDKWLYGQWIGKVRTGWPDFDLHLEGGLGAGELGTVLAPSNRGKSMALVNIAYGAAGIGSGKNVVIFTHEMSEKIYAKRIAARMMFRFPKRIGNLSEYEEEFLGLATKLLPGNIRIIGGSNMTTLQVEAALERLKAEGYNFDLIIDDYPDLLLPPTQRQQRRFELSDTYKWYRALGDKYGVPVWAASQTNRGAYKKKVISEEDIAEDIGKVNISDVIVAICQTQEEADDERCRIFLPKVRDGLRNVMFDAKFYPAQQAIIMTNVTDRRTEE